MRQWELAGSGGRTAASTGGGRSTVGAPQAVVSMQIRSKGSPLPGGIRESDTWQLLPCQRRSRVRSFCNYTPSALRAMSLMSRRCPGLEGSSRMLMAESRDPWRRWHAPTEVASLTIPIVALSRPRFNSTDLISAQAHGLDLGLGPHVDKAQYVWPTLGHEGT
jgi:hypothetical protein